jgi:hypothetical protein
MVESNSRSGQLGDLLGKKMGRKQTTNKMTLYNQDQRKLDPYLVYHPSL